MPCECYATTEGERAAMWKRIRPPDGRIPIQGPIATPALLLGEQELVYFVDVARLTPEEFERLAQEVAAMFHEDADEVRREILEHGMPVKPGILVHVCPMHVRAIR